MVNKTLILETMFIKKGVSALLLGLCFSILASSEHLNHASSHNHDEVYEFECEYTENFKTPKLIVNEHFILSFPVEIFYLFNLNIHIALLEKNFDSRAPPES